jgi:DNA-binding MarR family transcriptional regulator
LDKLDEDIESKLAKAFLQFNKLHRFSKNETENSERNGSKFNLRYSEFHLLFHIRYFSKLSTEGVTASEISARMQLKPPTINPLLSNLEKLGLIVRKQDKIDRRFVRIEMTPTGEQFILEHEAKWLEKIRGLSAYLGEKKSNDLVNLMNDVYNYFEENKKK